MFFRGSRYEPVPTLTHVTADGRTIRHKALRILPDPRGSLVHIVRQDDRLDRVAQDWFGNAELWWRVADANTALDPDALIGEAGRTIIVPAPGE
ncbi:hypothetical protein FK498_02885 [Elioraea sp. Yellowstone]|jgi:hypothetical protein|uniref:hypothetical protein n=1 Tax=Elioraea sp. Yellowstone TaxID=2592070 RepID=UPI001154C4AC|nr:hypothetical protein [Elioraea sp. Yellowstone]TQF83420.1 hypothetical protein FK498_02885 [Elioraea sp. Yellowstone]